MGSGAEGRRADAAERQLELAGPLASAGGPCYRRQMSNLVALDHFVALPEHARLLGLDLGTKTIGLALSDVERRIATPLETIQRIKFRQDAAALLKVADKHAIAGLVIGLPLNMDGTEGPRVQSTRAFVRNLAPLTALPIVFWDERMSTLAVTRTLLDADASRARRAAVVDKMAAAYILQGALDRLGRLTADASEPGEDDYGMT
ncbi:putative holliday junction resolvase [Bosea lupini]|uniref:Putative pre-16S rRNA nuclease n=2 Tax=Bosea lupini TaxID=1036779 RepID=A0A1H7GM70_9HYPH|nr:putative holliday junction resolvase [Bosea lupini]